MPRIRLSAASPATTTADAVVIGLYEAPDGGEPIPADPDFAAAAAAAALAGATGKAGSVVTIPGAELLSAERIVAVGLGASPSPQAEGLAAQGAAERVRRAAGVASRVAAGWDTVVSTLSRIDLRAAAEGHLLGAYQFTTYKEPKDPAVQSVVLVVPAADDTAAEAEVRRAEVTAEAVAFARDLVNSAPNHLPPAEFAARAAAAAQDAGLDVQVLDENDLARGGFGGILAVGAGSARPPRLVRVAYRPRRPATSVALVGKGITFDSGGISIKPALKMDQMTADMAGAAAVIATAIAAAKLELPVAVTAYAALAENLPSGSAYRPGDVIRHYGGASQRGPGKPSDNSTGKGADKGSDDGSDQGRGEGAGSGSGKTSHILNTDAEGRLVLADAIVRAAEDHPDFLLETSTLTGAQVMSLGKRTMGVMGEPELRDRVAELGREVGEDAWAMPLPEHLREGLDSPLADLQNIGAADQGGGMLVAGHYLAAFVPEGLPFAHLDVAGPAFHDGKPYGYTSTGGTGVPVRTLLAVLEDLGTR